MNFNRRRSGGLLKKRVSLNRSRSNIKSNKTSMLQEGNSCIEVVLRTRPPNEKEIGKGRMVVTVVDEHLLLFDPPEEDEGFFFQGQKQLTRDLNKKVNKNVRFLFDRVFKDSASNEDVFNESVKPIIENLLSGFNCSVFAYGATGAGKTFTMLGCSLEHGIIYHIVQCLYHRMEEMTNKTCELNISYLEVYNETVKDLLRASPPLALRDDSKSVTVAGLSFQKPTCADHLLQLLHFGNKNRTQHPTDANAESSRSHAVFQIYLKIKDKVTGLSENVQLSKMSLIDLAGSERACVVSNHGRARQMEGANINKSLLALGACINALSLRNGKTQHIPYRNSKLTRILKDSLGGNCKTVMIAAVSPSGLSYEDTYKTLRYAERAKSITINLKRNSTQVDVHLSGYKEIVNNLQTEIDSLKQENESLKRKLADAHEQQAKRQKLSPPEEPKDELRLQPAVESLDPNWKDKVDTLCEQIYKLKKNILDSESSLQSFQARQFWRQFSHNRIAALTEDRNKITRSHNKLDTFMKSNQARTERLTTEKIRNQESLEQKMEILRNLLESEDSELKKSYIKSHMARMETSSLHSHLSHAIELSTSNFKQTCEAWKVCEESLQHVRNLQFTLKGHGYLTADLVIKYDELVKQAECGREVAWADIPPAPNALQQEFLQHLLLPSSGFSCPVPSCEQEVKTLPQTTYCSVKLEQNTDYFPGTPSTPSKDSVCARGATFASPSVSTLLSPNYYKERQIFRRGSPYPVNLKNLNTEELLELINEDEGAVRRSLEETFNATAQEPHILRPQIDWKEPREKTDLHNLTFSPVGFAKALPNRATALLISTPTTDRLKSLQAGSFNFAQEQCSAVHTCNSHLLPEAGFHTHMQMNSAVSNDDCQQMHVPIPDFYRVDNHSQCTGCLSSAATTTMVVAQQRPSCMFAPNAVCPSTVSRPGRLGSPRLATQQVGSVLPNIRIQSSTLRDLNALPEYQTSQGAVGRTTLASTRNGPYTSRITQKYGTTKENFDPQRKAKKTNSGIPRHSVTPLNKNDRKLKKLPNFKTGK